MEKAEGSGSKIGEKGIEVERNCGKVGEKRNDGTREQKKWWKGMGKRGEVKSLYV